MAPCFAYPTLNPIQAAKKVWRDIAHLVRSWELLEAVPARLLALSRWSYAEECGPVERPLPLGER